MTKYSKILVALDGSSSSENALRQALELATDEKSWILCISVIPDYQGELELVGVNDISSVIKGKGEAILEKARAIAMEARGMPVRVVLESGEIHSKISGLAEAENCDLIVLGRQNIDRVTNRIMLSNVISRVIGYSKIDVLVVPEKARLSWKKILFSIDGSFHCDRALKKAVNFAKVYGEEADIFSVVHVTDEFQALAPQAVRELDEKARMILEKTAAEFETNGIKTRKFAALGDPSAEIVKQVEKEAVDAIIMGSHGRTGLRRLLMGSVTESVIAASSCPVLVVHP